MQAYSSAYYYAYVPFPFAYAQLMAVLMLFFVGFIPYYVSQFSDNSLQSFVLFPLISFFVVFAFPARTL